jgi:hypothetical protein
VLDEREAKSRVKEVVDEKCKLKVPKRALPSSRARKIMKNNEK